MSKSNETRKTCWACKRIIVGKSTFGLCSSCRNKGGSVVGVAVVTGLTWVGKKALNALKNTRI